MITTWAGSEFEAVIVSTSGLTMRVAIAGHDDAVELRFHASQWFSEYGEPVEVRLRPALFDGEFPLTESVVAAPTATWVN